MGNRRRLAYTISAVAALARAEGEPERAVILDAVAAAAIAEIGAAASPYQPRVEPTQFAEAAAGSAVATISPARAMTLDQAVEESLAWLAGPRPRTQRGQPLADTRPARTIPTTAAPPPVDGLTRRQREVVALLAHGFTNRQVGEVLVLTEGTVENYVQRILGKLGFNKRAQIAAWAVEHGFGSAPAPD